MSRARDYLIMIIWKKLQMVFFKLMITQIFILVIPYYGIPDFSIYNYYTKLIPYIQEIGAAKYDVEFHILEPDDKPFEFIEAAHLSPVGETQFANILYEKFNYLFSS